MDDDKRTDKGPRRGSHSAPAHGTGSSAGSTSRSSGSAGRHDAKSVSQRMGKVPEVTKPAASNAPQPPASDSAPVGVKSVSRTGSFKQVSQPARSTGAHGGSHEVTGVAPVKRKDAPKRRGRGLLAVAIILVIAILGAAAYFFGPQLYDRFLGPSVKPGQPVTIVVEQGAAVSTIASDLKDAGVITSARQFSNAVKEMGADTSIYPGTYSKFVTGMSNEDAIAVLVAGPDNNATVVTIPEGYTLAQIARTLEANTHISASDFIAEVADASAWADEYPFLADAGTGSLEGFLFPKTYEIAEDATAHDVVRMLLDQYVTEVSGVDFSYAAERNLTEFDVIIIASIIEKEAVNESQRPDVASVIYNRLRTGMRLQLDSTVIYALGDDYDGGGFVSYDHLEVDSPYNTYIVYGLPAGPICNPGITAIQAAAHPNETDYLYFVNENIEGDFLFSSDYNEFLANKKAYEELLAKSGA